MVGVSPHRTRWLVSNKLDKAWKSQLDKLRKAETAYRDAAAAADAAHEAFVAGKADADMKPKELTSLSAKAQKSADKRDKAQSEYKRVLQFTNQAKTVYWMQDVPAVLRWARSAVTASSQWSWNAPSLVSP